MFSASLRKMSGSRRLFSTNSLRPDVCIVGGGPTGVAMACTLAESNFFDADGETKKIMLLDSSKAPALEQYSSSAITRSPEPRVVTLSPASIRLLKSINVL